MVKNDVMEAEILWAFHTFATHNSYKSNETIGNLSKLMFPDSKIAKKSQCEERKAAYFTVFGIAEFLKSLIVKDVTSELLSYLMRA